MRKKSIPKPKSYYVLSVKVLKHLRRPSGDYLSCFGPQKCTLLLGLSSGEMKASGTRVALGEGGGGSKREVHGTFRGQAQFSNRLL